MNEEQLRNIIETSESKQRDCIVFSKKFQTRKQEDLHQYYEDAIWALKFALHLLTKQKTND